MRRDDKMITDAEFEGLLDRVTIRELGDILSDAMQAAAPMSPRAMRETETVLRLDAQYLDLAAGLATSTIRASSTI